MPLSPCVSRLIFLWRVAAIAGTAHLLLNTPFLQGLASPWALCSVQLSLDKSGVTYPLLYVHSSSRSHFISLKHFIFSYLHSEYEAKQRHNLWGFPINLFSLSTMWRIASQSNINNVSVCKSKICTHCSQVFGLHTFVGKIFAIVNK